MNKLPTANFTTWKTDTENEKCYNKYIVNVIKCFIKGCGIGHLSIGPEKI